jgi:hypothetical protein
LEEKFFDWIDLAKLSDSVTTPRNIVMVPDEDAVGEGTIAICR